MGKAYFESVYEALWSSSADAVILLDLTGCILSANPSALRLLGYEEDDLVGQPVEVLVPEDRRARHLEHRHGFGLNSQSRLMRGATELVTLRRDGTQVPVEISLTPVEGLGVLAIMRDMTPWRELEAQLRELSFRDGLTGLYNRLYLQEEMDRLERGRYRPIGVLVADVDGLKEVNDSQGHAEGDALIVRVGELLARVLRVEDIVARVGGDEFVALVPGADEAAMEMILERIRRERAACWAAGERVSVSVGGASASAGDLLSDTMREADARMYAEKRQRKACADPDH